MPASPSVPESRGALSAVESYIALQRSIDALIEDRDKYAAQIVAAGSGTHSSSFGSVLVTIPAAGRVSWHCPDEDQARELAGVSFRVLFDREVSFSPCKSFEDVAPKLLTPAKARDLIALCRKETAVPKPSIRILPPKAAAK